MTQPQRFRSCSERVQIRGSYGHSRHAEFALLSLFQLLQQALEVGNQSRCNKKVVGGSHL
jgi:hypothetical protein